MFVHNKQKRPVTFSAPSGALTLVPGWTELSDVDAAALRLVADPIGMVKNGLLEFGATKKVKSGDKEVTVGKILKDLPEAEAEALIAGTNSLEQLEKFKVEDPRDAVHLAVVNRIEEVKNYKPGEDETEDKNH